MLRHFELFLACRYLRKKRLAFFCVVAVALSVAMLIVVTSVMGGFVEQLRSASHGFYGDIIVRADSLLGFPYYDELIAEADNIEGVEAATPVIRQIGLLRIDQSGFKLFVKGVSVLGIKPEGYSKITKFKESLWKQSAREGAPSLEIPAGFADKTYLKGACIVGTQVVYNRRREGGYDREDQLYDSEVQVGVMVLRHKTGALADNPMARGKFLLVDDSETSVPLVDEQTVYIPFDVAQRMSDMVGYKTYEGQIVPGRTSQVQIRTAPGADIDKIRQELREAWSGIVRAKGYSGRDVIIETWDQQAGIASVIAQLERDRTLMTILFVIMDVVCVFLILTIFYVIVTEKIPDIGIIKSVGGSGGLRIAGVFLTFVAPWILGFIADGCGVGTGAGSGDWMSGQVVLRSYVVLLIMVMLISAGGSGRTKLSVGVGASTCGAGLLARYLGRFISVRLVVFIVYLMEKISFLDLDKFGGPVLLGCMLISCRFRIRGFFYTLIFPCLVVFFGHSFSRLVGVSLTDQISVHSAVRIYAIYLTIFGAISIAGSKRLIPAFIVASAIGVGWLTGLQLGWGPLVTLTDTLCNISLIAMSIFFLIILMAVSSGGVGRIFLAYGASVGVVGAVFGLGIGWIVVVNINQIHNWFAETFGWRVYDPSVLLFPHIPNAIDWNASVSIMVAAVAASLLGSMIPARRAALMEPIKALRYE